MLKSNIEFTIRGKNKKHAQRYGNGWWIRNETKSIVKFSCCINTTGWWCAWKNKITLLKCAHNFCLNPFSLCLHLTFIYILLSSLSLWVIKPWKWEREKDGFGGGGPTVPQSWKWVFPKLLLTYLMTHNSCFKYPWSSLWWLVCSDSDQNRKSYMVLNSWWSCN